jgi:hypothetical protein
VVRFSDMLGGSDDSEAARAATMPLAETADEIPEPEDEPDPDVPPPDEPEPEPEPSVNASPQEVLDRLTQYAAEHVAAPKAPQTDATLEPVADDLLPHAKHGRRR